MSHQTLRTARTRKGKIVILGILVSAEGGWLVYVMHRNGYAVRCFIPG